MKTVIAALAMLVMFSGISHASTYIRGGGMGTVLSTNLNTGNTTLFMPAGNGGYFSHKLY